VVRPREAAAAATQGRRRILELERIRQDSLTLANILEQDPEIYEWYNQIACFKRQEFVTFFC
jgi:hypothetical protein